MPAIKPSPPAFLTPSILAHPPSSCKFWPNFDQALFDCNHGEFTDFGGRLPTTEHPPDNSNAPCPYRSGDKSAARRTRHRAPQPNRPDSSTDPHQQYSWLPISLPCRRSLYPSSPTTKKCAPYQPGNANRPRACHLEPKFKQVFEFVESDTDKRWLAAEIRDWRIQVGSSGLGVVGRGFPGRRCPLP